MLKYFHVQNDFEMSFSCTAVLIWGRRKKSHVEYRTKSPKASVILLRQPGNHRMSIYFKQFLRRYLARRMCSVMDTPCRSSCPCVQPGQVSACCALLSSLRPSTEERICLQGRVASCGINVVCLVRGTEQVGTGPSIPVYSPV
jgi:hypothetical protein